MHHIERHRSEVEAVAVVERRDPYAAAVQQRAVGRLEVDDAHSAAVEAQLGVAAGLGHLPALQHKDAVGVQNRAQAVRNEHCDVLARA